MNDEFNKVCEKLVAKYQQLQGNTSKYEFNDNSYPIKNHHPPFSIAGLDYQEQVKCQWKEIYKIPPYEYGNPANHPNCPTNYSYVGNYTNEDVKIMEIVVKQLGYDIKTDTEPLDVYGKVVGSIVGEYKAVFVHKEGSNNLSEFWELFREYKGE